MDLHWLLGAISLNPTDIGLPNSTGSLSAAIANTIKLLMILIGSLSVIFIIIGGLQMVGSNGDPKNFARGRETVLYSVVGIVVAVSAYAIVSFIGNSIK